MRLRVGDQAPDFDVTDSAGKRLRLADFRGSKNVVLYFYPRDFTRVCTAEACGFRDMYEDLAGKNTEVIGVSADSDESHQKFAGDHRVPFSLVADPDKALATRYGATGFLTNLIGATKRITFVIDREGKVAGIFDSAVRASNHLDGVREAVARLA